LTIKQCKRLSYTPLGILYQVWKSRKDMKTILLSIFPAIIHCRIEKRWTWISKCSEYWECHLIFCWWIECYRCPFSMLSSLIYIRRSTPLTILTLQKPIPEFTYLTASSSLPSTRDGQVLTPMSINYVIKVLCSYCDTIAIGATSYEYKIIWSQLSTNRFKSPWARESALSYTHWVCIGLMIAANDRTLN